MSWLAGLVLAGFGALMTDWVGKEAQNWAPKLILRFLSTAVRRLPETRRTRLGEEWHASLLELPTPLSQIMFTVGIVIAAERIRARERGKAGTGLTGVHSGMGAVAGAVVMTGAAVSTTRRVRGIVWFSACVMIVLGFYLVNIQVMTMRTQLKATEASIRKARREITVLKARVAAGEAATRPAAASMSR